MVTTRLQSTHLLLGKLVISLMILLLFLDQRQCVTAVIVMRPSECSSKCYVVAV